MVDQSNALKQRKAWRYAMMSRLYALTKGNESFGFEFFELAEELSIPEDEAEALHQYLYGEGLIKMMGPRTVTISHQGVVEIEHTLESPEQSTEHFPAEVIRHVTNNNITINAPVGAVQTGDHNTAHVAQHLNNDVQVLLQHLRKYADEAPPVNREDASEVVDRIESEVKSSAPKVGIIQALGAGLSALAADTAREGILKVIGELATKVGSSVSDKLLGGE